MHDEFIIRHRQRLKNHFVNTSKVLLYGYRKLSDTAKITYQVIDGFDWEDKTTGASKGYAFPATETIAAIRNITVRTAQRHISELEAAGLLTRTRRKHEPSILYIEDVSKPEIDRYLALFVDKSTPMKTPADDDPSRDGSGSEPGRGVSASPAGASTPISRNDKLVVSPEPLQTTKVSLDNREEERGKKTNVNVEKSRRRGLQSMQALMQTYTPNAPPRQGRGAHSERTAQRDHLAQTLAATFHDADGLGCYRRIADKLPAAVIYQLMAEVKEVVRQGRVRTSRAAFFVSAAKRYAHAHHIALGFERQDRGKALKHPLAAGP